MKKNIILSFSFVILFFLLLSAQLHRPIFADNCPLSCPLSSPLTGPISGPSLSPSIAPTETATPTPTNTPIIPSVSVLPSPSETVTDTPIPTSTISLTPSVSPVPSETKHHGDLFGRNFDRFFSFWERFFQFFTKLTGSGKNNHVSYTRQRHILGISSEVKYVADSSCAQDAQRSYSSFAF